jgi:hypothetical protein
MLVGVLSAAAATAAKGSNDDLTRIVVDYKAA